MPPVFSFAVMPNRYVREDAIESEPVNALSWRGEVFFRRLINRVDDFGCYPADPKFLRPKIYPLQLDKISESDVTSLLSECEAVGLLFVYIASDGKLYLVLNKWETGRAKFRKYPEPPKEVCERMQTFVYRCLHTQTFPPTPTPTPIPTPRADSEQAPAPSSEFFPTLEDVKAMASGPLGALPECAETFWNEMEACGWKDAKSRPIGKWRNAFTAYAMRWRANGSQRAQQLSNGQKADQHALPSVWQMKTQFDAVVQEMKKIENRGHEDPVAGLVIRNEDRPRYKELKKTKADLNAKLATGGK